MRARPRVQVLLLVAAVVAAVALRLDGLTRRAPFIDEAESAINALTIHAHGFPVDRYLGLPIYENTLTEPWPEHPEYEFRDSSYSARGLAVYHGWLPLYAIAASFAAFDVRPDPRPRGALAVRHSDEEIERRVFAARLPSVLFAALFVLALYLAGRSAYGADAGLAAAWAGALSSDCIYFGQFARYYSATLAMASLAAFAVWRLRRRDRSRDWLFAALALSALFHTHMLAFGVVLALFVPRCLKALSSGRAPLVVPALAMMACATAPWLVYTGYFEDRGGGPPARELLEFPRDYVAYFVGRPAVGWSLALLVASGSVLWLLRRRLPVPAAAAWRNALPALKFHGAWLALSYASFLLLMPAASAFYSRLTLALVPAGIVLVAIATAAGLRSTLGNRGPVLAPALLSFALIASGRAFSGGMGDTRPELATGPLRELIEHLRGLELGAGTRLYSLPDQHLVLQWTTGLPVQSIAPVRREFLDRVRAEVVVIETADPWPAPTLDEVERCADGAGMSLTRDAARAAAEKLRTRLRREMLAEKVASVSPPLEELAPWMRCVVESQRARRERPDYGLDYAAYNPAMLRGTRACDAATFWPAFFYRFVGPEARQGERVNYSGRLRRAHAHVLESGWTVIRSPAPRWTDSMR